MVASFARQCQRAIDLLEGVLHAAFFRMQLGTSEQGMAVRIQDAIARSGN